MKLLRILYLLGNVRFIFDFDYTPYNVYTKFKNVQRKRPTIFLNHVRKNLILEKSSTIIAGQSSKLPFSSPRTVPERFRWEISLHRIDPATPTPCLLHFVPRPTAPTRLLATKSCRQRLDGPYSAQ